MSKTYIVAEGFSFVANGKTYDSGEEIPEEVFADKTVFASMLSKKKIVTADGSAVAVKASEPEAVSEKEPEAKLEKSAEAKATKKAKE